jgi:hypothetical protein
MGINHRRTHVSVPEQLLNRPDVMTGFEQVRRKAVPQRMACGGNGNAGGPGGILDGPLKDGLVEVMPAPLGRCAIYIKTNRRTTTARPIQWGVGVFQTERVRERNASMSRRKVDLVLCLHAL